MLSRSLKSIAFTPCALGLSLLATSAQANLVTNGSFEQVPAGSAAKGTFQSIKPQGWSSSTGGLIFLDGPGTAANGSYLSVYGPFPNTSPDGGNFVEADGAKNYSGTIFQTISGLSVGTPYTLTFYQAAGQQAGYTGSTTEEWAVTFGSTQYSSQYALAQGGVGAWEKQTMTFIATATSQVLSFLAVGTPNGEPPISFLDGVDLEASVPEPASLTLISVGALGVAAVARRRRAKRTKTV